MKDPTIARRAPAAYSRTGVPSGTRIARRRSSTFFCPASKRSTKGDCTERSTTFGSPMSEQRIEHMFGQSLRTLKEEATPPRLHQSPILRQSYRLRQRRRVGEAKSHHVVSIRDPDHLRLVEHTKM